MNAARRKAITAIAEEASALRSRLEDLSYEEQEARDNLPESLQGSERADAMDNALQAFEDALNAFDELDGYLETARGPSVLGWLPRR